MLKENKNSYIHVFKIATGEEIIARVVDENDQSYYVEKPLQMMIGPQGAQFAPFMFMARSDKTVNLNRSSIVADSSPAAELENQYLSAITGIALTQKSSIITN
jgi:hypothetical protein